MKKVCFLNGEWLQEDEAKLSVFDSGFLYGYAVFETIRIVNGKALWLPEHLKRLEKSIKSTGIKRIQYNLNSIVAKILKLNNLKKGVLRITVTAGRFNDLPWVDNFSTPTVLVTIREPKMPKSIFKKGVKIVFMNEKCSGHSLSFPGIKSTSYIQNVLAKIHAKKKGAFEAIFVSPEGFLKEGATSNLFFIKNRVVYTPALELGILPGITRKMVIKVIRKMGMKIQEGHYRISDFNQSDEAFLTNSTYGIAPVSGKENFIVNEIRERYESLF